MGFYEELSKYYDRIFPPEQSQIEYISGSAKQGDRILDVACGSGGYTAEIYKKGYKIQACDLDEGMVGAADKRFSELGMEIKVKKADMTRLSDVYTEEFDLIYCIGNSIVHLESQEQVYKAVSSMKSLLSGGGKLILQIMNFDRIKKYDIRELPEIKTADGEISFKRYYNLLESGRLEFKTTLDVKGQESLKNKVLLLPLTRDELSGILQSAGFKDIRTYGDFNKGIFKDDSYVLVTSCVK